VLRLTALRDLDETADLDLLSLGVPVPWLRSLELFIYDM